MMVACCTAEEVDLHGDVGGKGTGGADPIRSLEGEHVGGERPIFTDVFRFLPALALRVLSIFCRGREERSSTLASRTLSMVNPYMALITFQHHQNGFEHL